MPGVKVAAIATEQAGAAKAMKVSKKRAAADDTAEVQKKQKKSKTTTDGAAAGAASSPAASGAKPSPQGTMSPDAYRAEHAIVVKALGSTPELWQSFEDAPFPASLQRALKAAGFSAPSPIQAQGWPLAMTGRDVLAVAKTGSGKTCGYLLPAIAKYLDTKPPLRTPNKPGGKGSPAIVVMAPTRELAVQINQQATTFAAAAGLRTTAVYGGAPKGPQIRELKSGAQIVIATPGRLKDLLNFTCSDGTPVLDLNSVQVLVLDEADRMCDMGFEEDIKQLVAMIPTSKQTLFFTATWPKAVERVANTILKNPIHVSIGSGDQLRANKDITQHVQVVDGRDKYDLLVSLIKSKLPEGSRTIIFCNKKYLCDEIESSLWEAGHSIAAIHGDRPQEEREWAVGQLRAGKLSLLVATDVAARGLDIKELQCVINYDFPNQTEDYIHRIGRTGRAGATGTAYTFFTSGDGKHASELVKILREAKQEVPAELEAMNRGGGGGGSRGWGGKGQGGGNKWRGGRGGQGGRGGRRW